MLTEAHRARRPRIAFIINSLAGGGAERVFCRVIAGLEDRLADWRAQIVLLDDEARAYAPPSFLPVRTLGAQRILSRSVSRLVGELRRFRPDVAVSFLSRANCANVLASRWCGHRTVISERVATAEHFGAGPGAYFKRRLTGELYRRADAIVAVSAGVREGLVKRCGVPADRISVIPNPVDVAAIRRLAAEVPEKALPARFIVSVNRLAPNKNVGLQIEALAQSGLPHHLVILGDGPELQTLQEKSRSLGVSDRVHFMGFIENPFAIVARAELFLSTSNAEGFPNALAEAMALGLPCVSTNCPSGPAEILAGDPWIETTGPLPSAYGVLTPMNDTPACAEALRLLSQPQQRAHYSTRAEERGSMYAPEAVIERYWRLISPFAQRAEAHLQAD